MKRLTMTFIVALASFLGGIGWLTLALQLPRRTSVTTMAGPGTFPVAILIIFVILSGLLAVMEFKKVKDGAVESAGLEREDLKRILIMIIAAVLYLTVVEMVGYIVATACLIAVLLWLFGFRNKMAFAVIVVASPLLIFFVFQILLKIQLP